MLKFFETSTRNLLANEATAGVGHHVALSVVGTERLLESGFFRAKFAQENLIKASSIPYSIVRATQFFRIRQEHRRFFHGRQPSAPATRAHPAHGGRRCRQCSGQNRNQLTSKWHRGNRRAGTFHLDELIRRDLAARKDPREVITGPQGRYYGIKVTERALVPGDAARLGETRFENWLKQSTKQASKPALQPA